MMFLNYGQTISTDTFVAHMDFQTSGRVSDHVMMAINNISNWFWYLWLVLAVHTALSLIADFVVRPTLWLIKTAKVIVFGYN